MQSPEAAVSIAGQAEDIWLPVYMLTACLGVARGSGAPHIMPVHFAAAGADLIRDKSHRDTFTFVAISKYLSRGRGRR